MAAVGNFEDHGAVALLWVFRADGDEVRGELDFSVFQIDGIAEVDDALIVRVGDGEREVDASGNALVGSGNTELFAVQDIGTGSDFYPEDARVEGWNGKN